ncbi:MAG: HNH endonuclease [Clostridiales bacterium]|nr:HNH endonuclease [Clostridiales bacterium]
MAKKQTQFMDLNRETAMRLWIKSFGKVTKVKDFTGREIVKGAYNDRNSEYGWNVDHILPQSRGGKTADHNLICCHILTNDEKANKFPCFVANKLKFEIVKVENHYEIREKDSKKIKNELNFFDSASGISFFNYLKENQSNECYIGTVFIQLEGLVNTAVIDFIDNVLDKEHLYIENDDKNEKNIFIVARNNYMPLKTDTAELLNKCILLKTYLSAYFKPCNYIVSFDIYYRLDIFEDNFSMHKHLDCITREFLSHKQISYCLFTIAQQYSDSLFLNKSVLCNTEAGKRINPNENCEYTKYNDVFRNLKKNLEKEVNGK